MNAFADSDVSAALVLSLIHFIWQGSLIAGIAFFVASRFRSATNRYNVFVAALALMAIAPVTTLAVQLMRSHAASPQFAAQNANSSDVQPTNDASQKLVPAIESFAPIEPSATEPIGANEERPAISSPGSAPSTSDVRSDWRNFTPYLLTVYFIGVAAMLLRVAIGLWGGRRLKVQSTSVVDLKLLESLQRQAKSLGLSFIPMLAYCERVAVPTVIGIMKPTILLPLALTSGLTIAQIEVILAHELAHLRRYDHLVNLAQRLVESMLYFHPAVWWLSRQIRIERELCCDDLVVAAGAVPLDYAKSLLRVAEMSDFRRSSHSAAIVSLLATDQPSALRQRIARLLGSPIETQIRLRHPWAGCGLLVACVTAAWGIGAIERALIAKTNRTIADESKVPEELNSPLNVIDEQDVPSGIVHDKLANAQPVGAQKKSEIDQLIDRTLEAMSKHRLTVGTVENPLGHSPWQIMNWIRGFGRGCLFKTAQYYPTSISADEWLGSCPTYLGEPVWQSSDEGARAHPFTRKYVFEGFPGQFLAWMAAADIPIDFPLNSADASGKLKAVTVRDIVNDVTLHLDKSKDLTWVLLALSHYLPMDAQWTDGSGEQWSIDRIVEIEVQRPIKGAPNGGYTRLFALANARNRYRLSLATPNPPLPLLWVNVGERLTQYIQATKSLQNADGYFSKYDRSDYDLKLPQDANELLISTGERLVFLSVALPDDELNNEWIDRAIKKLCTTYLDYEKDYIRSTQSISEAFYALRLFRERRARLMTQAVLKQHPKAPAIHDVLGGQEDSSNLTEAPSAKSQLIENLKSDVKKSLDELAREKEQRAAERKKLEEQIERLRQTIEKLNANLDEGNRKEAVLDEPAYDRLKSRLKALGEINEIDFKNADPQSVQSVCESVLSVLKEDEVTGIKVAAVRALTRILKTAEPPLNARTAIAQASVAELKDSRSHWLYQVRLIETLRDCDIPGVDEDNKPFIVESFIAVIKDPERHWRVRSKACWALGRVPLAASAKPDEVVTVIANFFLQLSRAAAADPQNSIWRNDCFWNIYLTFKPNHTEKQRDMSTDKNLEGGLLARIQSESQSAYELFSPIIKDMLHDQPPDRAALAKLEEFVQSR